MCVDVMMMSYAYVVSFTGACGVCILRRMGDRMPPCGTSL